MTFADLAKKVTSATQASFLVKGRAEDWIASMRALEGGLVTVQSRRAGQVPGIAAVDDDGKATILIIPPQVERSSHLYLVCKELAEGGDPGMSLPEGGIYMSAPSEVHVLPEAMKVKPPETNKSKTNLAGDRCTPELYEARRNLIRAEAGKLYERGPFEVDYAARGVLTCPVVDPEWAPVEYRELPVFSVRT